MNSFTFKGQRRDYLTVLKGRKNYVLGPVTRIISTIAGLPGGHLQKTRREVRVHEVPIRVKNTTFQNLERLKEDLAAWLYSEDVDELVFDDDPERTYYAVLEGKVDLDELVNKGKGKISFVCPDPDKFGSEVTVPFTESTVIQYSGSSKTFPVVQVTFASAANEFIITHSSGKHVRAVRNFDAGDVLEIDFLKRKFMLNGGLVMPVFDYSTSKWFSIEPGENTVTAIPIDASINLSYTERWL